VVVAAGAENQSQQCQEALATLCQTYWYPLYCSARRRGCGPDEAADAVQGFFLEVRVQGGTTHSSSGPHQSWLP